MKATAPENIVISEKFGKSLKLDFYDSEFSLDGWGNVDNYAKLSDSSFVFMECEKGQKHPNTNVLKLWPYLEKNEQLKIFLIHYIFPDNNSPQNRIRLCHFLGKKLEKIFPDRFRYYHIYGSIL
ncbi:MAG: hypothetical protein WC401_06740 [Bacteroidales bacterium]|jgi:hypothetical protein|nr:hypothetical protein [Bacteroidales bacterium]